MVVKRYCLFLICVFLITAIRPIFAQGGIDGAETIGDPMTPELGNGGYDTQHIDLALTADPTVPRIDGVATLTLKITQDQLASFTLDLRQFMAVSAVEVDDSPVAFDQGERKLRIYLPAPLSVDSEIRVAIYYGGDLRPVYSPYYPYGQIGALIDGENNRFALVTEPDTANTWFPSNDHPSDAATYRFHFTVAQPFEAVGNGVLLGITDNPDGTRTFEWDMHYPMASYLAVIAVADYNLIEDTTPDGIALSHYVYSSSNMQLMDDIFAVTSSAISILEDYFGVYPFDSYGHVITPMTDGALETQTMTSMPFTLRDMRDESEIWDLIVHELSHSWFGNSIRLGSWADIWLNEGFATFAEWLGEEVRFGEEAAILQRARTEQVLQNSQRETALAHPEPAELFSAESYYKGAWVLQMLKAMVGEDVFYEMVRKYTRDFAGGTITTQAFFDFASDYTGYDLSAFRQYWLESTAIPAYDVFWEADGRTVALRFCNRNAAPAVRDYSLNFQIRFTSMVGEQTDMDVSLDEATPNTLLYELPFEPAEIELDPTQNLLDDMRVLAVDEIPDC